MLKEVSGDILLSKAAAIVHSVAPLDHFNQGLSLSLRERWPALYKDFRHYCTTYHPKPGELWTWGGPEKIRIISLFTQSQALVEGQKPGKASLENLHHCLKSLKKEIDKEKFSSVAITRLACGVGGLAWPEVKHCIERDLSESKADIYLYSNYIMNQRASE